MVSNWVGCSAFSFISSISSLCFLINLSNLGGFFFKFCLTLLCSLSACILFKNLLFSLNTLAVNGASASALLTKFFFQIVPPLSICFTKICFNSRISFNKSPPSLFFLLEAMVWVFLAIARSSSVSYLGFLPLVIYIVPILYFPKYSLNQSNLDPL